MTESQLRFLREIASRVGPERVVGIHVFPPIRQGGIESGIAVVAAEPDREIEIDTTGLGAAAEQTDLGLLACDPTDAAAGALAAEPFAAEPIAADDAAAPEAEDEAAALDPDASSPDAALPAPDAPAPRPPAVESRHAVLNARYRLVLKGPDRGKWEVEIVAEADAPMGAIESVVRGVQRRAGEAAEAEYYSGDAFREALAAPAWTVVR
jgi:hypothetical protein